MEKIDVKHFRSLSPQQILAQPPGRWGDYSLLDVMYYFDEKGDRRREAAVRELILRSPENDEMVDYWDLYFYQVNYARSVGDYAAALRWAYAALAYEEQRQPGLNRANAVCDIADSYLQAGSPDAGLSLYARCLEADPSDIWIYNSLALMLIETNMADLALEVIERALELVAIDDPEQIQEQLSDLLELALEGQAGETRRPAEVTPAVLEKLRMALRPAIRPEPAPPESSDAYLPPIDSLISPEGDGLETVYQEIIAQAPILAPDLIRMAFDENLGDTPAPDHALAILRRLSAGQMADELAELSSWLDRARGDWHRELLTERAGKIGGYYTDELEAIAADSSCYYIVRVSMVSALAERAQKCPEQRERIVRGMRVLLTRPEAYQAAEETFIAFLIGDMEDLGAKELYPEIEAAFAEDRVDPTIISLRDIQESWGMPVTQPFERPEEGFNLPLQCNDCGRVRYHFVRRVTVDTFSLDQLEAGKKVKYTPFIMDREIVCPKCGARDRYELTPQASFQLMAPAGGFEGLAALLGGQEDAPKWKPDPRVEFIGSMVFNKPMHPLEGLDRYRKLIEANPQNVALYFRMGALLRTIHRYPQALEAFREGYDRGTDNPEFIVNRALAEHDLGDRALARNLYEESIRMLEQQPGDDPDDYENLQVARRGLRLLKRNKPSPWQMAWLGGEMPAEEKPSWYVKRRKGRRSKKKKRRR